MAQHKGLVKFVSETNTTAIVEESAIISNDVITSTGLFIGNGTIVDFSGYLITSSTGAIKPGSVQLIVAGTAIDAADTQDSTDLYWGTITGTGIDTSTGYVNYRSGLVSGKLTSAPTTGQYVSGVCSHSVASLYPDAIKLTRGNFTKVAKDDSIFYNYDAMSVLGSGLEITETY